MSVFRRYVVKAFVLGDGHLAQIEAAFGKIDLFYANAGFPYYEEFDYVN